jgi:two-component system, chemotaxis family, sensor kinase CheA
MSEEFEEEIREFLIESNENLANLDREIVELERNPEDAKLISSVFRTIHTIKGTCGFFGFDSLGSVAHITENILSQVREGQRELTPPLISLILEAVDKIKALMVKIETEGGEGEDDFAGLRTRLEEAYRIYSLRETPAGVQREVAPVQIADVETSAQHLHTEKPQSEQVTERREATGSTGKDTSIAGSTVRVDVELLDKLMNLVGELAHARNQFLQATASLDFTLRKTSQRLNLITSELQEGVMKTRMQPIEVVWNKLPRLVRDLAAKCGKKIQIEVEGAGMGLDRTIIEAIKDPLTHIIRNACDHGIETLDVRIQKNKNAEGLLLLRACNEGEVVNIEVSDDGAGIDPEKLKKKAIEKGLIRPEQAEQMSNHDALRLIFMPGFSTAAQITHISGRGVGMDIVKTNIEKIGGSVEVMNRVPYGTTIQLKIPLTRAMIPGSVMSSKSEMPMSGDNDDGNREK